MKNILSKFLIFIVLLQIMSSVSFAGTCKNPGNTGCANDFSCTAQPGGKCDQQSVGVCQCTYTGAGPGTTTSDTDPVGTVKPPFTTGFWANNQNGSGLIALMRAFLALIFTVGGIYAFIRVVLAGLKFMSAGGDAKAIQQSWDSIWQAMLGLVIIVSSLIIAVILGQLLFGDATAILIPKIYPAQ